MLKHIHPRAVLLREACRAAVEDYDTGDDKEEYLSDGCQREKAVGASFREADREVALEPRTERRLPSRLRRKPPRYREEDIRAHAVLSICRAQEDF